MHSGTLQIPYLIILIGPTAVGKTISSFKIAEHINSPILSADARQFYKELNIGTAKPKDTELEYIRHYFINNLSIHNSYSAGAYESDFNKTLKELSIQHSRILLTGGSGMFIDAAVHGLNELPPKNKGLRTELSALLEDKGIISLQKMLQDLDPEYYERMDRENPHRLIRAIEICKMSGKTYTELRKPTEKKGYFKPIWIGLKREREELYQRINHRVDMMIENGLLKEAENLMQYQDLNALQTVGYRELFSYFKNEISLDDAIELIKRNSRRYAKRQMTWWRKREYIQWYHPDDTESILQMIDKEST